MGWKNILHIWITDSYNLNIEVGKAIFVLLIFVILFFLIFFKIKRCWPFNQDVELNISLGGIGLIKIKSNHEVAQIAHKAWAELTTRKAGLPIDIDNDVIREIYDSWYQLFKEIRILIKNIPINQIKNPNTKKLINLLVESLNDGLRPHLTKWQARFIKWYNIEKEKDENKTKTPQEIQKLYPFYDELIRDLININQQLVLYTNEIKKLSS